MSQLPSQSQSPPPVGAQTSSTAVISLISGIVSFFMAPLLGAIIAIITGNKAKKEIRASGGLLTGDGLATTGLVLGWVNLVLMVPTCGILILMVLGVSVAGLSLPLMCLPFVNEWSVLLGG